MKKRPGFSIASLLLFLLFLAIISSVNFSINYGNIIRNFTDSQIKSEIYSIDAALSNYAKSHAGEYPNNLQTLIDARILPPIIDLSPYKYTIHVNKESYTLTVKLNDNSTYTSPLSK